MAKNGHRHLLIVYQYMLDRWWKATLAIGLSLLALAGGLGGFPILMPQVSFPEMDSWGLWGLIGAGGFAIFLTIFLASIRKSAYVQAYNDHLRLVTPFLRLNISYRRIRRTYSAEMGSLFPTRNKSARRQGLVRPLAARTAVILELTSFPISQSALLLFISPLFFPDKTPRLALLVPDWIAFSTGLESRRGARGNPAHQLPDSPNSGLLSSLSKAKK